MYGGEVTHVQLVLEGNGRKLHLSLILLIIIIHKSKKLKKKFMKIDTRFSI